MAEQDFLDIDWVDKTPMLEDNDLREQLAELEHTQWMAWAGALEQAEELSPERLERWHKLYKSYSELTEKEKEQDRIWADKIIAKAEPYYIEKGRQMEGKENRPKIICLCGSSRFCAEMAVIAWGFEKDGYITVGLHLLPVGYTEAKSHLAEAEGVAEKMDELHLRKIDLADKVFIVNKGGYIGDSTAREIAYAKKLGKPVIYLEALKGEAQ